MNLNPNRNLDILVVGVERTEKLEKGNLGVRLENERLELPLQYFCLLQEYGVCGSKAIEFISYIQCSPSAIALALGWSPQQAIAAYQLFATQFKEIFPESILRPPKFERGAGAIPPEDCETKPGYQVE